jgi:hypothetical protein
MDYQSFERKLLRLMFQTNAPLTPVHVAYYLDMPIAEARAHLDAMVQQGVLELDSDDSGHLMYKYPLRPPTEKLPEARPRKKKRRGGAEQAAAESPPPVTTSSRPAAPVTALVPATQSFGGDLMMLDRRYSPAAAAALSLFLPGVGQIYSGRVPQGVAWMLATGLGYLLFLVPGLILHICCIVNAAAVPAKPLVNAAPAR